MQLARLQEFCRRSGSQQGRTSSSSERLVCSSAITVRQRYLLKDRLAMLIAVSPSCSGRWRILATRLPRGERFIPLRDVICIAGMPRHTSQYIQIPTTKFQAIFQLVIDDALPLHARNDHLWKQGWFQTQSKQIKLQDEIHFLWNLVVLHVPSKRLPTDSGSLCGSLCGSLHLLLLFLLSSLWSSILLNNMTRYP